MQCELVAPRIFGETTQFFYGNYRDTRRFRSVTREVGIKDARWAELEAFDTESGQGRFETRILSWCWSTV